MKIFQSWFKISLFISLFLMLPTPGNTQTGNMSDVTGPNPIPGDTNPSGGNNNSGDGNTNSGSGNTNSGGNNNQAGDNTNSGGNNNQAGGGGNTNSDSGNTNSGGNNNQAGGNTNSGGNNNQAGGGGNTNSGNNNQAGGGGNTNSGGGSGNLSSGTGNTNSGGNNNQAGGNTNSSGNNNQAGGNTNSGGNNNQAGGNTNSGGNNNQAGGNTNSGGNNRTGNNASNDRNSEGGNPTGANSRNAESEDKTQQSTESEDQNRQAAERERTERQQAEREQEEAEQKKTEQQEETEREEQREETNDRETQPEQANVTVDRSAYDSQLQQADPVQAVQLQEEFQAVEFQNYLGIKLYGDNPPPEQISASLSNLSQVTGKKSALIYVSAVDEEIITFSVLPSSPQVSDRSGASGQIHASKDRNQKDKLAQQNEFAMLNKTSIPRAKLLETVKKFQGSISDEFKVGEQEYLQYSQQLYEWIIKPIEAQLKENGIDILVFALDDGLRGLPIAALSDGQQFLVEKYALAVVPSFGLTDIGYVDVRRSPILAMGASEFSDKVPLPAVPVELQTVIENPRRGEKFLNQDFTIANFRNQNLRERFSIIHLGTHAEFQPGDRDRSYIQFFDNRLSMSQLVQLSDELGWSSSNNYPVELLVLSACQTALGDRQAELGFAGLAVAAGVKSVLASLWNVSDLGTLGLMSQFYQDYSVTANKAEALRQAQLAMLKGQVRVDNGKMILANGESIQLPPEFPKGTLELSHPYYWASFTMIGNWN
jgi:CHAT domain-containing protein